MTKRNIDYRRDKDRAKPVLSLYIDARIEAKKEMHMTPRQRFLYWQEGPVHKRKHLTKFKQHRFLQCR